MGNGVHSSIGFVKSYGRVNIYITVYICHISIPLSNPLISLSPSQSKNLSFSELDLRKPKRFSTLSFGFRKKKKKDDENLSKSTFGLHSSGTEEKEEVHVMSCLCLSSYCLMSCLSLTCHKLMHLFFIMGDKHKVLILA